MKVEIENFKDKISSWKKSYPKIDFIFNSDLEEVEWGNIKYLVVADNPGDTEKENGRYLYSDSSSHHSKSGVISKKVFEFLNISDEVIILNKCPISTSKTEDLKDIPLRILEETQEYMVNLVYNLYQNLECKIYIFGFGGCYDYERGWLAKKDNGEYYAGQVLSTFFEKLKLKFKSNEDTDNIYIMKHFSYWNIFSDLTFAHTTSQNNEKLQPCIKVTLKRLEEKNISPKDLMSALESLNYRNELFSSEVGVEVFADQSQS